MRKPERGASRRSGRSIVALSALGTPARETIHVLAAVAILLAGVAVAGDFEMIRWSVDGGAVLHSAGGDFEVSGTPGQSDAGLMMTGQGFELTGGFWFRQSPADCNCDSAVDLFDFDAFSYCMNGTGGGLIEPECVCFDLDHDGDVDLLDFNLLQQFIGS